MAGKYTDCAKLREVAVDFLCRNVVVDDNVPFVVHHPVFEYNPCAVIGDDGRLAVADITTTAGYDAAVDFVMARRLPACNGFLDFLFFVCKAYRLSFLEACEPFLSAADFSVAFREAWITTEFPSRFGGVDIKTLLRWFRVGRGIMSSKELARYNKLGDVVTLYRGSPTRGDYMGLSWTTDKSTARWFATRWSSEGYVYCAEFPRTACVAVLLERDESEVVVDPSKARDVREEAVNKL